MNIHHIGICWKNASAVPNPERGEHIVAVHPLEQKLHVHDSRAVYCPGSISNLPKWFVLNRESNPASFMLHAVEVRGRTSPFRSPGANEASGAMISERILMSLDSLALDQRAVIWYANFILLNKLDYGQGGGGTGGTTASHYWPQEGRGLIRIRCCSLLQMWTICGGQSDVQQVIERRLSDVMN